METSQLLLVSSLGLAVNLFGMFAMGGHHHHVRRPRAYGQRLRSNFARFRDTRTPMDTPMVEDRMVTRTRQSHQQRIPTGILTSQKRQSPTDTPMCMSQRVITSIHFTVTSARMIIITAIYTTTVLLQLQAVTPPTLIRTLSTMGLIPTTGTSNTYHRTRDTTIIIPIGLMKQIIRTPTGTAQRTTQTRTATLNLYKVTTVIVLRPTFRQMPQLQVLILSARYRNGSFPAPPLRSRTRMKHQPNGSHASTSLASHRRSQRR